jgi:hypothetical protein
MPKKVNYDGGLCTDTGCTIGPFPTQYYVDIPIIIKDDDDIINYEKLKDDSIENAYVPGIKQGTENYFSTKEKLTNQFKYGIQFIIKIIFDTTDNMFYLIFDKNIKEKYMANSTILYYFIKDVVLPYIRKSTPSLFTFNNTRPEFINFQKLLMLLEANQSGIFSVNIDKITFKEKNNNYIIKFKKYNKYNKIARPSQGEDQQNSYIDIIMKEYEDSSPSVPATEQPQPQPQSEGGAKRKVKPKAKPSSAKKETKPKAKPASAKKETNPKAKPTSAKKETKPKAKPSSAKKETKTKI